MLNGAFPVPAQHGGGFLFHNGPRFVSRALLHWRAYVFADVGSTPFRVSFSPGFLFVRTQQGHLVLDAKTGRRRPLPVAGLAEIAMLPDGQTLALTVTAEALTTRDGSRWVDLSERLPSPVTGIAERDATAFLTLLSGQVATGVELARLSSHGWAL
jgi:hypothetical protein